MEVRTCWVESVRLTAEAAARKTVKVRNSFPAFVFFFLLVSGYYSDNESRHQDCDWYWGFHISFTVNMSEDDVFEMKCHSCLEWVLVSLPMVLRCCEMWQWERVKLWKIRNYFFKWSHALVFDQPNEVWLQTWSQITFYLVWTEADKQRNTKLTDSLHKR